MSSIKIFAITTRGLESICADEISALPNVKVDEVAYRRVFASCESSLESLLTLRTVDDVFLHVSTWHEINRTRESLNKMLDASSELNLVSALETCKQLRVIQDSIVFSVTANFVGKRNFNTEEIKRACATGIQTQQSWTYSEDDSKSDLNIRIFIEGETAIVGVRLAEKSLSKRSYKQEHVLGSLKPVVASALLRLAGINSGARVLDPCCGAGTILIEADQLQVKGCGGDINQEAIHAASINASESNANVHFHRWDARTLPISNHSVDFVISNLPWGIAVNIESSLPVFYQEVCAEIERVVTSNGKVVLLTNLPDLVKFKK